MARRQHDGCPVGGIIYVTWIKKGARSQEAWVAVGSYCEGCGGVWRASPEAVNSWGCGSEPGIESDGRGSFELWSTPISAERKEWWMALWRRKNRGQQHRIR